MTKSKMKGGKKEKMEEKFEVMKKKKKGKK